MTEGYYTVVSRSRLAKDTFRLVLQGDTSALTRPGQFVNLKIAGKFLRRPISVCDYDDTSITLLYKVVGEGTETMSRMQSGEQISLLTGLGNGFHSEKSGDSPLLIGGGAGVPPLYRLAKDLQGEGKRVQVILGFRSEADVFYEAEFRALGAEVYVTTEDGSKGEKGFVTDVMKRLSYTYFYTCGPMPMFRAVEKEAKTSGEFSFEERMGCGFGACMGCSCRTLTGSKRICKEGPVMEREEILW